MPLVLPALGDPVVVGDIKYRISRLTGTIARVSVWRAPYDVVEAAVDPRTLSWDARAGLWRTDRCTPTT